MRRGLLGALLALLPALAAADAADEIKSRLKPFEILRGDFTQSKSIPVLKKPLKSSGSFVLVKGKGVLWNSLKPMPSLLKVTKDEISQIKDGKAAFSLKSGEQPALKLVGEVLFSVFSADLAELKRHFEIRGKVSGPRWSATLTPKESWVAKVAKEINLEGGGTLDSLLISEAGGDSTSIRFSHVSTKARLSPAEKALFD